MSRAPQLGSARERRLGLAAVVGGVVGILYFPLHALAFLRTDDGMEGLLPWADRGYDLLGPLLDWDDVDTVYKTYGKIMVVITLGLLLGLAGLWSRRRSRAEGVERWAYRIAFVGYSLLVIGTFVEYWTRYLDFGFGAFTAPGFLVSVVGSTLLGIALLRRGAAPRLACWLLALAAPLLVAGTALFGHLSAGLLPLDVAWIVLGVWLASPDAPEA